MARVNEHYLKLKCELPVRRDRPAGARRSRTPIPTAQASSASASATSRGPCRPTVIRALHEAVDEMARAETFRGYGPEPGYEFLTELIAKHDYGARGVSIAPDEIFVSDGGEERQRATSRRSSRRTRVVALTDPVYPGLRRQQRDGRAHRHRRRERTLRAASSISRARRRTASSRRCPIGPSTSSTCAIPNNPTGAVMTHAALERWVDYARETRRRHPVRRGLRGVHPRCPDPALDLRGGGRARGGHRVALASRRARASPAPAARTPSCPRRSTGRHGQGRARRASTGCGSAGSPPSSTASPTSSSGAPPPSTPRTGSAGPRRWSTTTWRTPASSATGWRRPASPCTAARNAPYIWLQDAARTVLLGLLRQAPERGPRGRHARARASGPAAKATSG